MTIEMDRGFFSMSMVHEVCRQTKLSEAKKIALDAIAELPNAKKENIYKATHMVNNSYDIKSLAISMTNFILAHPTERLRVK